MNRFKIHLTFIFGLLILCGNTMAQCDKPSSTFSEKEYELGDEIKIPGLKVSNPIQDLTEIGNSLEKVVEFMNEHPELSLEISTHTELRGKTSYNKQISERYIKLIQKWMNARYSDISKQIKYKAYGETLPLYNQDYLDTVGESQRFTLHKCNNRVSLNVLAVDPSKIKEEVMEESEELVEEQNVEEATEENESMIAKSSE